MKLKETDLGAFEAFPGENGQVYYHDENHGYLDNAQGYVSSELGNESNELISHHNRKWLSIVTYPDGEWVDSGRMILRESGIISDPERVFEHGEARRFDIPLVLEICERCRGKGTMGNPSLNGTTLDWWQEHGGPDWKEDLDEYIHGDLYDVRCEFNCDNGKAFGIDWTWIVARVKYALEKSNRGIHQKDEATIKANNEYATEIRRHIEDYNDYQAERRSEERWGY